MDSRHGRITEITHHRHQMTWTHLRNSDCRTQYASLEIIDSLRLITQHIIDICQFDLMDNQDSRHGRMTDSIIVRISVYKWPGRISETPTEGLSTHLFEITDSLIQ